MNVLITLPYLDLPGGVAYYYASLRRFLGSNVEYLEIGSRDEHVGSVQSVGRLLGDWRRFLAAIKTDKFDLVHINPSLGPKSLIRDGVFLCLASWYGTKTLVFFRGWDPACESVIRRYFSFLFRYVFGKADAFVLLGSDFEEKIRSFGISKPVFIETTIVDDEIFSQVDSEAVKKHSDTALNQILFLSRLDYGKGVLESLEAFRQLRAIRPEVELTVAGDGPVRDQAERFVESRDIEGIQFVGYLSGREKQKAFESADIYLFTSFHEGMPNSVLEAMAFGLPVVTSAVGGLKDFFEDGQMGYVVDPKDPENICVTLDKMMTDHVARRTMGAFNSQYAKKRFSASTVAKRLIGIYEQVGGQNE